MKRSLRKAGYVEKRVDLGRCTLNYVVGPAGEQPLLLIPGQTMPWESYTKVLPMLAGDFEVYAIDIHGHGKSDWTPGAYTFRAIGQDLAKFLAEVVGRPALVSGNSSGGVLAVWLAAYAPEWVLGIMPEDPPLFSCEWPRLRDATYAYRIFEWVTEALKDKDNRDIAGFFGSFHLPVEGKKRLMSLPLPLRWLITGVLWLYQRIRPKGPIDLPFVPLHVRLFIRGLSEYDPAFTAAFLDGSPGEGFDHAEALALVGCPMLLLQAHWFLHEDYGLVGAMSDDDVEYVRALVEQVRVHKLAASHIVHIQKPRTFVSLLHELDQEVGKKEWMAQLSEENPTEA